jgi:hypothetical protein
LAVWVDAISARGERAPTQGRVVVLTDGEDRSPGGMRPLDRRDAVVRPGGQVDDDAVDVGKGGREPRRCPNGHDVATRTAHEIGQARRPDEVIGQDGDARGQASISAR